MRIMIFDRLYGPFVEYLYQQQPGLSEQSYHQQWQVINQQWFSLSDSASYYLNQLGVDAQEFYLNVWPIQIQWLKEFDKNPLSLSRLAAQIRKWPWIGMRLQEQLLYQVALKQVQDYKPDIVIVDDLVAPLSFLKQIKALGAALVGKKSSLLPPKECIEMYDLVITSYEPYLEHLRHAGTKTAWLPFAFDNRILEDLPLRQVEKKVTFIGGLGSQVHQERCQLLDVVAQECPLQVYGYGFDQPDRYPHLKNAYQGEAWGLEMYRILQQSALTINSHGRMFIHEPVCEKANNMRLYEATGVGALLLTDYKQDLNRYFKLDQEVVAYGNASDLISKIKYYLEHPDQAETIASQGQIKTTQEYNYQKRMQDLKQILEQEL